VAPAGGAASRSGPIALAIAAALGLLAGCGGHEMRTLTMRTALDAGRPREAVKALNEEIKVNDDASLPNDIVGDNALLVLDRASVQQSLAQFPNSKRDFQAADKAIDMLDLSHNAGDSIGEYVFSGSSGRYVAPPYEKLLINTLNLLNYLETNDLDGARIEARRLAVMNKYIRDDLKENNAVLGLGGFLAGLAYEKSGEVDEALRWYDEALEFGDSWSLGDTLRGLAARGNYTSPRIKKAIAEAPPSSAPSLDQSDDAELIFVVGYGRVPHKIPQRIPIGLALTYVSGAISPYDRARANRLAAQGLVTWVNYPTLAPEHGGYEIPSCVLDGKYVQLEQAVDVSSQVRDEWKKVEGKIILSAITRMIARVAVGQGIQKADSGVVGLLASLGTQATLTALDTPDTRSWETLPARVAIARVRLPAGRHSLRLSARGYLRQWDVTLAPKGWAVVSLQALR
jgi:hypothetical protein